jgi:hypothetical protein
VKGYRTLAFGMKEYREEDVYDVEDVEKDL